MGQNQSGQAISSKKNPPRRSRWDENGRDYECGCGKKYLSSAALFTHVKTKHDGNQPSGTVNKLKQPENTSTREQSQVKVRPKIQKTGSGDTLQKVYALFDQFSPQILLKIDEKSKGNVPVHLRIPKERVKTEIYEQYTYLTAKKPLNISQQSPLDLALALFLLNMGNLVNEQFYEQYLMFAEYAKTCFVDFGKMIYRNYWKQEALQFDIKSFNTKEARYYPLVHDYLIKYFLPKLNKIVSKKINCQIIKIIAEDFGNWLYFSKMTDLKIPTKVDMYALILADLQIYFGLRLRGGQVVQKMQQILADGYD